MADNNPAEAPSPDISIRRTLQSIADQINDGSNLVVETKVQVVNTGSGVQLAGQQVAVARTEVSIDGDRIIVVPVTLETGEFQVPKTVYDLHERHVAEAMAYRRELLHTLVDFVRGRR